MPPSAIENLIDCQSALIRALDGGDVSAVEAATAQVARALEQVRQEAPPRREERGRVDYALRQAEAARGRVNFLTDRVAQRIERLPERRGHRTVQTYTNTGKIGQKLLA